MAKDYEEKISQLANSIWSKVYSTDPQDQKDLKDSLNEMYQILKDMDIKEVGRKELYNIDFFLKNYSDSLPKKEYENLRVQLHEMLTEKIKSLIPEESIDTSPTMDEIKSLSNHPKYSKMIPSKIHTKVQAEAQAKRRQEEENLAQEWGISVQKPQKLSVSLAKKVLPKRLIKTAQKIGKAAQIVKDKTQRGLESGTQKIGKAAQRVKHATQEFSVNLAQKPLSKNLIKTAERIGRTAQIVKDETQRKLEFGAQKIEKTVRSIKIPSLMRTIRGRTQRGGRS